MWEEIKTKGKRFKEIDKMSQMFTGNRYLEPHIQNITCHVEKTKPGKRVCLAHPFPSPDKYNIPENGLPRLSLYLSFLSVPSQISNNIISVNQRNEALSAQRLMYTKISVNK